jgi:hypothetical protein
MIDSFSFGSMVIYGQVYTSDLIIYPDGRIVDSWWRKQGHQLVSSDIKELIKAGPEIVIVGTGASGLMKPEAGLLKELDAKGIESMVMATAEAVGVFNLRKASRKVGACFHLTC